MSRVSEKKMDKMIQLLLSRLGGRFSESLGIRLKEADSEEVFKWFLVSLLFGARISERIATNTYKVFEENGIVSADKILDTGWDGLVRFLDEGGYVRYDFKTATKLLEVAEALTRDYSGDLMVLHAHAKDVRDLERRIESLGKGIGGVTTNIFLRELRGIWRKAEPLPQDLVLLAATNLGLLKTRQREESLHLLQSIWRAHPVEGKDFADFEAALVRLGKDFCRRRRCADCWLREECTQKG